MSLENAENDSVTTGVTPPFNDKAYKGGDYNIDISLDGRVANLVINPGHNMIVTGGGVSAYSHNPVLVWGNGKKGFQWSDPVAPITRTLTGESAIPSKYGHAKDEVRMTLEAGPDKSLFIVTPDDMKNNGIVGRLGTDFARANEDGQSLKVTNPLHMFAGGNVAWQKLDGEGPRILQARGSNVRRIELAPHDHDIVVSTSAKEELVKQGVNVKNSIIVDPKNIVAMTGNVQRRIGYGGLGAILDGDRNVIAYRLTSPPGEKGTIWMDSPVPGDSSGVVRAMDLASAAVIAAKFLR